MIFLGLEIKIMAEHRCLCLFIGGLVVSSYSFKTVQGPSDFVYKHQNKHCVQPLFPVQNLVKKLLNEMPIDIWTCLSQPLSKKACMTDYVSVTKPTLP